MQRVYLVPCAKSTNLYEQHALPTRSLPSYLALGIATGFQKQKPKASKAYVYKAHSGKLQVLKKTLFVARSFESVSFVKACFATPNYLKNLWNNCAHFMKKCVEFLLFGNNETKSIVSIDQQAAGLTFRGASGSTCSIWNVALAALRCNLH